LEGIPNEDNFNQNDTFFLSRNSNFSNLADSNFFSYGEKSLIIKQLNEMEKQTEDDNKSNFTIELDLEKQVDSLIYDEDDDLNDAKYLENDKSNWSSNSNLLSSTLYNKNQHNMTTPVPMSKNIWNNQRYQNTETIESEEKNIKNNILTPANSTVELNKIILENIGRDKKKEKELNISTLLDKCTDTFTGDSNTNINITGNKISNFKGGGPNLKLKSGVGEK
jgi:hypothetical protein